MDELLEVEDFAAWESVLPGDDAHPRLFVELPWTGEVQLSLAHVLAAIESTGGHAFCPCGDPECGPAMQQVRIDVQGGRRTWTVGQEKALLEIEQMREARERLVFRFGQLAGAFGLDAIRCMCPADERLLRENKTIARELKRADARRNDEVVDSLELRVSQAPWLRCDAILTGEPELLPCVIDEFMAMCERDGRHYPFTCECGTRECAGLVVGVESTRRNGRLVWNNGDEHSPALRVFDLREFRAEVERAWREKAEFQAAHPWGWVRA